MNIITVTPPPVEPVSDGEAFYSLKITTDPEADVSAEPDLVEVQTCVKAAREECERLTSRSFVQRTLRLLKGPTRSSVRRGLEWYMNGGSDVVGDIELPAGPVISVSSVKFYDEANTLQTVDPANYFLVQSLVPKVKFVDGFEASLYLREDAIQVEYVAGYIPVAGTPTDYRVNIPAEVKQAILLLTHAHYDGLTPAERESFREVAKNMLSGMRVVTL